MIFKHRTIPLKIHALEALLRRSLASEPKRPLLEDELSRTRAGFYGEISLDYILSYLSEKDYLILQDVRLSNPPYFFQMDFIIITAYYLLILDAKNYSGQIYFDDDFNQIIQTKNSEEKALPDPIPQVTLQKSHLHVWLNRHNISDIPIEFLVVLTNPYTIIRASPSYKEVFQKVIHKELLTQKIALLHKSYSIERFHPKEMKKISKLLTKHHQPYIPNVMEQFKMSTSDIITGTHCPECFYIPMNYQKGKWHCRKCRCISKNAHISSLKDYSLLIKPSITNKELRTFLHLPSYAATIYLLSKLNLHYSGHTKGRKYELLFDQLDKFRE